MLLACEPTPQAVDLREAVGFREGEEPLKSPGICAEALLPSAVSVAWEGLASDTKLEGTAGVMTLVVTNVSDRALQVRSFLEVEVDVGKPNIVDFGTVALTPGEAVTAVFSLPGQVPQAQRGHPSSRGIQASAEVMDSEGRRIEMTYAAPIYYHWDSETLWIYGEEVLRTEMHHGLWAAPVQFAEDEARFVRRVQVWSKE